MTSVMVLSVPSSDAESSSSLHMRTCARCAGAPTFPSRPQHALVCSPESGEDRCVCRGTWAGSLCDAPLQQLDFNQQMTGQLDAGSWAYFTITVRTGVEWHALHHGRLLHHHGEGSGGASNG